MIIFSDPSVKRVAQGKELESKRGKRLTNLAVLLSESNRLAEGTSYINSSLNEHGQVNDVVLLLHNLIRPFQRRIVRAEGR